MDSLWSSSASSGELLPVHVYVFPPAGGEASVNQLDILFFSLSCLTVYHAYLQKDRKEHLTLALSGFLLGLSTEQASLRFGGTHCHASGWAHFHECSSINSVLFYCPWVHTGALCAKRMVDQKSWAFPYVAGALFFGMCGVYESQGPMVRLGEERARCEAIAKGLYRIPALLTTFRSSLCSPPHPDGLVALAET